MKPPRVHTRFNNILSPCLSYNIIRPMYSPVRVRGTYSGRTPDTAPYGDKCSWRVGEPRGASGPLGRELFPFFDFENHNAISNRSSFSRWNSTRIHHNIRYRYRTSFKKKSFLPLILKRVRQYMGTWIEIWTNYFLSKILNLKFSKKLLQLICLTCDCTRTEKILLVVKQYRIFVSLTVLR